MKDWSQLYNYHQGKTILVVCNGPSLKNVPLDFLKDYPTFGFNNIFLLDGFTPTYYAATSHLVILQSMEQIKTIDATKFIKQDYGFTENYEFYTVPHPNMFSLDPQLGLYEGHSVTHVALQIIYYMGYSTVLIVGLDHRFVGVEKPDEEQKWEGDDPNHFSPEYFRNLLWYTPNLEESAKSFAKANEIYEKSGRRIVNLTPGTALDVFEKDYIGNW